MERTSFPQLSLFKGDNSKGQLENATRQTVLTWLYAYQILSKYLQGY